MLRLISYKKEIGEHLEQGKVALTEQDFPVHCSSPHCLVISLPELQISLQ